MNAQLTQDVDAFWDVVYGDPELLRAQFDAIVAASWDEPPTRPQPPGRPGAHRPAADRWRDPVLPGLSPSRPVRGRLGGRGRGPPATR